jgi:hypothetical protein
MPDWAPVEHDPFAAPSERPPPRTSLTVTPTNWSPIDHDPFAKPEPTHSEPEKPEHEPGVFETMSTDLHNQLAAVSQGTTPNIGAHMPNLLSDDVQEGDDRNLYFKNAEGKLQRTDTNKHVVLRDPSDQKLKVFSRTEETNEGIPSSLGRLLGIGMGAGRFEVNKAASSIAPAIAAAKRIKVDVPWAIASDSPSMHLAGQILTKAPGGAPMQKAVDEGINGVRGLSGALGRAGEAAGGIADTKRAGEAVTTGLEEGFKPRSQQLVGQLYDRVDSLVDPKATAPLTSTQKAVGDILAKKQAYGNESLGPAVDAVAGALQRKGGLTYAAVKDLRSSIGEMIDNKFLPPTISGKELNSIYGALSEDLGNAAEATGGPRARAAWKVANDAAKSRSDALETLNKVIGPKTRADEGVMDTIHRMAGTGPGADISTLTATRKALSGTPGAWNDVASTVIGRLGKNSQGEFSPALFIRDYGNLSPAGKGMLFHSVGNGAVIPFLDDIAHVSKQYVQAGKLGNPSGSAGHAAGMAVAGAVMAGIAHSSLIEPMTALSAVTGSNLAARMLGAPATAAGLARWTRAYDNLVRIPGARSAAAFNVASRNLGSTTAAVLGDPSLAPRLTEQIKSAAHQTNEATNQ